MKKLMIQPSNFFLKKNFTHYCKNKKFAKTPKNLPAMT